MGLAGLWNTWTDKATGEVIESYTMLTVNADDHPLMSRMHRPDPALPTDEQDKRSVVAIEQADIEQWLRGSREEASELLVAATCGADRRRPGLEAVASNAKALSASWLAQAGSAGRRHCLFPRVVNLLFPP